MTPIFCIADPVYEQVHFEKWVSVILPAPNLWFYWQGK